MAFLPGDKIHSWYRMVWNNQEIQLHLHYRVVNDTSALTTIAGLDALNTYLADTTTALRPGKVLRDSQSGDVFFSSVNSQRIYSTRTLYRTQAIGVAGAYGGAVPITGNNAACISFKGAAGARNNISNRHIGPMPADGMAGGILTPAWKLQMTALGDALDDPIALSLGTINLLPIINHSGAAFSDVVGFSVSDRVGTMRRRTVGLGI